MSLYICRHVGGDAVMFVSLGGKMAFRIFKLATIISRAYAGKTARLDLKEEKLHSRVKVNDVIDG